MSDYIMRLVQQVARMMAAIIAHRQANKLDAMQDEIDRACRDTTGLPIEMLALSQPENLRDLLAMGGGQRHARAIFLAELFLQRAEAELHAQDGDATAAHHQRWLAFGLIRDTLPFLQRQDAEDYLAKLGDLATLIESTSPDAAHLATVADWRAGNAQA